MAEEIYLSGVEGEGGCKMATLLVISVRRFLLSIQKVSEI
jgi:hypothetical protein